MSDSDTDSEDDARRLELEKRLAAFRQRRSKQEAQQLARCCQLCVDEDYNEYMGLADAFARHGFQVLKGALSKESDLPCLQWCYHRAVAWVRISTSDFVAFVESG